MDLNGATGGVFGYVNGVLAPPGQRGPAGAPARVPPQPLKLQGQQSNWGTLYGILSFMASGSYQQTKRLLNGRHPVRNQALSKPTLLRFAAAATSVKEAKEQQALRATNQLVISQGPDDLQALEASLTLNLDEVAEVHLIEHAFGCEQDLAEEESLQDQMAFFGEEAF